MVLGGGESKFKIVVVYHQLFLNFPFLDHMGLISEPKDLAWNWDEEKKRIKNLSFF